MKGNEGRFGKVRAYVVTIGFNERLWHFVFHFVPETWSLTAVCDLNWVSMQDHS